MRIVHDRHELQSLSRAAARRGERVGFVPTMGWLHDGHLALVAAARQRSEQVAMSIFVNPTQFGPSEDFAAYPRDLERDRALAEKAGVDWLFVPSVGQMYPAGDCSFVEVRELGEQLCGRTRPGHFRGVATVVAKLLIIVDADAAMFGEKDWQQLVIVRRMARDLGIRSEIAGCPTVREHDGLALSSRNVYLSPPERSAATALYRALVRGQELVASGESSAEQVKSRMRAEIEAQPLLRVDYVDVVEPETLRALDQVKGEARALVAAWAGRTRLIDNARLAAQDSAA